jgi:hypothetical protein
MRCLALLFLASRLGAASADEEAMFGGGEALTQSAQSQPDAFSSGENKADALQIGGVFYQQLNVVQSGRNVENASPLRMPLNLDAFFDARPNDRLRAYLGARLIYDSTLDAYSNPTAGKAGSIPAAGATTATALPNNPQVVLDSAWLKFDLGHAVFVTAGRQHAKWGSARIWNPTDALNPARKDPLQPYDLRLGSNMIRFDAPLGAVKGNLSAIALMDNPQPASTLQQLGGAFRAEGVVLGAELGADAVFRNGSQPRYGMDISLPLWQVDAYAEAALLHGPRHSYEYTGLPQSLSGPASLGMLYHDNGLEGPVLQASAGLDYSFGYAANRQASVGLEYFYNEAGAESYGLYPILQYLGEYQPFYLGKHYAALYLSAEGLDSGKHSSYRFSTLTNISDGSYVSRLDFSWLLLEYLTFGAYGSYHYGREGGEFNFALESPAFFDGSRFIAPIHIPAQPFDCGLSLRLAF